MCMPTRGARFVMSVLARLSSSSGMPRSGEISVRQDDSRSRYRNGRPRRLARAALVLIVMRSLVNGSLVSTERLVASVCAISNSEIGMVASGLRSFTFV